MKNNRLNRVILSQLALLCLACTVLSVQAGIAQHRSEFSKPMIAIERAAGKITFSGRLFYKEKEKKKEITHGIGNVLVELTVFRSNARGSQVISLKVKTDDNGNFTHIAKLNDLPAIGSNKTTYRCTFAYGGSDSKARVEEYSKANVESDPIVIVP